MLGRIFSVQPVAWILVGGAAMVGCIALLMSGFRDIPAPLVTYVVTPLVSLGLAGVGYWLSTGETSRVRHPRDRAIIVGSVVAIWFVLTFSTGIIVSYVHNALVSKPLTVLVNVVVFGLSAAAVEYTRQRTLLLGGRRNLVWFGALVAVVFALPGMSLSHVTAVASVADAVKLIVSDFIPALVMSFVLTYLAISSGLAAQLALRLGVLATTLLPPLLPKYDWYLLGMSSVALSLAVYYAVDSSQRSERRHSTRHHTNRAFSVMWSIGMIALILFMTGFFAYKPSAIMSDSMCQTFCRGSMVVVEKIKSPMDINIGDIIQYASENRLITHRVIAINNADDGSGSRVFTTRGDNNPSPDQPVAAEHIVGRVKGRVPYVGFPTVWLRELTVGNESTKVNGVGK